MADTQAQNPTGTENTETQWNENITQADLNAKIWKLWDLELLLFNGDGKIWWSSNDSLIDAKYNEAIKWVNDIKIKIDIINELILYFENVNNRIDSNEDMFQQDISPEVQKETQEIKEKIKEKVKELSQKYPEHTANLETYINKNLEYTSATVRYHEDHHDIKSLNIVLPILYTALEENLQIFENAVIQLNNIPQITDKVWALNDFIEENNEWKIVNLTELFTIDFIKENFSDGIKSDNTTFDIWGLIALSQLEIDQVKELNRLYKDPSKKEELIRYIEMLPLKSKKELFTQISSFHEILQEVMKKRLQLDSSIDITNTYNDPIRSIMRQISYLSWKVEKSELYKLITKLLNNGSKKDFDTFLSPGWEFDILISQFSSIGDRSYINSIFRLIWEYKYPQWKTKIFENKGLEIKNEIDKKIAYLQSTLTVEQKIELQRTLQNDPDREIRLQVLEQFNSQSQMIRPPEKIPDKPQQTISESQKQEMQQKIDTLWLNAKVSDEWKIVATNWGETISQKIWKNSQIEVNANEELILVNSMGYEMKYENNSLWLEKSLETMKTFNYMDKIWFWYFGNNLPSMLEIIKKVWLSWTAYMNIDENKWDFLSIKELHNIVIPIFTEIWFINKPMSQNISEVQEMNDLDMFSLIDQVKVNGVHYWSAFQKWKPFSGDYFKKFLIEKNNIKTI